MAVRSATAPTRKPTTTWPALAASIGGVELINLGMGGSALLDSFTARTMRDTPADLISIKIGINLVNNDLMRLRAFTRLSTASRHHPRRPPTTPLLVVSSILCPSMKKRRAPVLWTALLSAPGNCGSEHRGSADRSNGKLTLVVIRTS